MSENNGRIVEAGGLERDERRGDRPRVFDARGGRWFWIDNAVIDVFGPEIGAHGIALYALLARLASKEGESFPGMRYMMEKLDLSKNSILRAMKKLVAAGLVEKRPQYRTDGGQMANNYYLVDPGAGNEPGHENPSENPPIPGVPNMNPGIPDDEKTPPKEGSRTKSGGSHSAHHEEDTGKKTKKGSVVGLSRRVSTGSVSAIPTEPDENPKKVAAEMIAYLVERLVGKDIGITRGIKGRYGRDIAELLRQGEDPLVVYEALDRIAERWENYPGLGIAHALGDVKTGGVGNRRANPHAKPPPSRLPEHEQWKENFYRAWEAKPI